MQMEQKIHVGAFAGTRNGKGNMNTCIGYLSNFANSGGQSGPVVDKQVAIGYNVRTTAATSIALGYQLVGGSSGTIRIGTGDGGTNFTDNYIECTFNSSATWSQTSDERMKKEIENENTGLSFIKKLQPKTYKWRAPSEYPEGWKDHRKEQTEAV